MYIFRRYATYTCVLRVCFRCRPARSASSSFNNNRTRSVLAASRENRNSAVWTAWLFLELAKNTQRPEKINGEFRWQKYATGIVGFSFFFSFLFRPPSCFLRHTLCNTALGVCTGLKTNTKIKCTVLASDQCSTLFVYPASLATVIGRNAISLLIRESHDRNNYVFMF